MGTERVIIVGGGIAGLTAAASLALRGADVQLLEKNSSCGGLVNTFSRDGFIFDGGVRALENAGMVLPMLEELGIDLKMYPSRTSLGVEDSVFEVENDQSVSTYEKLLEELYPESREDVGRIIEVIRKFDIYMNVLFGSDSPFFKDMKRDLRYYLTTFPLWVFRFIATGIAVMRMRMPVEDFLHKITDDQSLIDIISQHFFKKTPAFFAMSYFSLYTDYHYPAGGVGTVPRAIERRVGELGGKVSTDVDIKEVRLRDKTLIDQEGRSYRYDRLLWCADLKQLYRSIDTEGLPAATLKKITAEQQLIQQGKGAESVFSLFLGVDQHPDVYQKISQGHFFYTPSRLGLGTLQREDLSRMLANWEQTSKEEVLSWLERFCRLNTYEISIPVLNDPAAAPEGKTGIIASFLMDHELVRRVSEDRWYEEFRQRVEQLMIETLSRSIYPGLEEHLLFSFSSSPLSIVNRVRSSEGAIVGWSFEHTIPIKAGILSMKDCVLTSLPDVYKAGQWSASPAGIPTCILTARLAADQIVKGGS